MVLTEESCIGLSMKIESWPKNSLSSHSKKVSGKLSSGSLNSLTSQSTSAFGWTEKASLLLPVIEALAPIKSRDAVAHLQRARL